jgi:hypothetical protein
MTRRSTISRVAAKRKLNSRRASLMQAVRGHDAPLALSLLKRHCGLANFHDGNGQTPLLAAIDEDAVPGAIPPVVIFDGDMHVATVEALCSYGAKMDDPDFISGFTPLCLATFLNYPKVVEVLIAHGADINLPMSPSHPTFGGWSPLMLAARVGSVDLCRRYIQLGADGQARASFPLTSSGDDVSYASFVSGLHDCDRLFPCPGGCTALDLARAQHDVDLGQTIEATEMMLHKCCRACGTTSVNMRQIYDNWKSSAVPGEPFPLLKKLRRCKNCDARYCSRECQKQDWWSRHKEECKECTF